MNELNLVSIIVQFGAVGIALYLVWSGNNERREMNSERKEERELWYKTVSNHMNHDMKLHEKQIKTLQKLVDVVSNMEKKLLK